MSKLGSGTKDFIIIRVCGVLILLYSIYLAAFFISTNGVNFKVWSSFFQSPLNKILTSAFFLAFAHCCEPNVFNGAWAASLPE